MSSQKPTTATNEKGQRQRVPFGGPRRRQEVHKKDPNYHYRYINDVEDRVQRALAGGYEFVTKKEVGDISVGDPDIANQSTGIDSRVVKKYRDHTAYLMKIKKEYWLEDQAAKQREVDEIDEAIYKSGEKVPKSYGLDVNYKR